MSAPTPALYRLTFALSVAFLFWSFVGGLVYLAAVRRTLPLQVDALDEAHRRVGRGDLDGALREYRLFTKVSPFESRGFHEMGALLMQKARWDEAAACYEAALQLRRRDARAMSRLGDVRLAQGRHADAISLYETALSLLPEGSAAAGQASAGLERAMAQAPSPLPGDSP